MMKRFGSPIERDGIEIAASLACIAAFVVMVGLIAWAEIMGQQVRDNSLLTLVIGFCLREVGSLSIGRGGNGKTSENNPKGLT